MNGIKSYADSYLYTKIPNYERNLLEFVMKAERIDKQSEAFLGIIEDTKRRQTSAVLSRVLMRDDVVLCLNSRPLPPSFKVFACKDVKTNTGVKVFIDCSGLIIPKNGYLVCSKIDVFCTHLLAAMTNLVYVHEPLRLTNNSTVVQSGCECFVALASHIFDYLRLNGYAENRNKISYILAMYFQVSLLGLDRGDMSVKNQAAKVSGIQSRDINAMEIYYEDEYLTNINTLLEGISSTFKTKGMTTDVFVEKWNWFYGTGTHFACELFPAFSGMITNAYCGSYVNNQKTIEKCCGRSMVNFTNAILRVGGDTIDNGFRYESAADRESFDRGTKVIKEQLANKKTLKEMQVTLVDLTDSNRIASKVKALGECGAFSSDVERSTYMKGIYESAVGMVKEKYLDPFTEAVYEETMSSVVESILPYLTVRDRTFVLEQLECSIANITKYFNNGDDRKNLSILRDDLKEAVYAIDPSHSMTDHSILTEKGEYGFGLTLRNCPKIVQNMSKDCMNTGNFEKIHPNLMKMVSSCKTVGEVEYLQKDVKSCTPLYRLADKMEAIEKGHPEKENLNDRTVRALQRRMKHGINSKKIRAHCKWIENTYRPALVAKKKELKKQGKE